MVAATAAMANIASSSSVGGCGPVVSPQYCSPHPIELLMKKKVFMAISDLFTVTDVVNHNNLLFKVELKPFSLSKKRIVLDSAGNPILTIQHELWSFPSRWQVFRGESSEPNDLIFSVKRSSGFPIKTKLKVYLPYNTTQELCDFKIKESYFGGSCVVYAGESSSAVVAEMQKKLAFLGNEFMVTVYPNVDQAFIVALIVILDAWHSSKKRRQN